jgi:membrane associated rhomboid family serine protease
MLFGLDIESAGLGLDPGALTPVGFATHWLFSATAAQWLASTLLLLALGPHLEEAWGPRVFAGFLLVAVAFPAAVYAFAGPSGRPLVGIAGPIAALTGAMLVRHGLATVQTWVLLGPRDPLRLSFEVPAYTALIAWFVGEVVMSVASSGTGPTQGVGTTVAFAGALFGAGAAWAVRQWDLESRLVGKPEDRSSSVLEAAQAARDTDARARSRCRPALRQQPRPRLVRALRRRRAAGQPPAAAAPTDRRQIAERHPPRRASGAFSQRARRAPDRARNDLAALAAAGDKTLAARVLRDALEASPRVTPHRAHRQVAAPLHRGPRSGGAHRALGRGHGRGEAKLEARVAEPNQAVRPRSSSPVAPGSLIDGSRRELQRCVLRRIGAGRSPSGGELSADGSPSPYRSSWPSACPTRADPADGATATDPTRCGSIQMRRRWQREPARRRCRTAGGGRRRGRRSEWSDAGSGATGGLAGRHDRADAQGSAAGGRSGSAAGRGIAGRQPVRPGDLDRRRGRALPRAQVCRGGARLDRRDERLDARRLPRGAIPHRWHRRRRGPRMSERPVILIDLLLN